MKNKLLVSVFAVAIAFAFTACETKSNVTDVCTDMVKESLHKSARSLVELNGQRLTISEYEFLGGVDDNRMVYRRIAFGHKTGEVKRVDSLTYEYGEWGNANTTFSLFVTPTDGSEPYTLLYKGNAFITPDGRSIGGEGVDNTARVEKWEKTLASLPNTDWEAMYEGDYVLDSVFEDSIRTTFIPPMTFITDTIQVFKGKMDTLSADTTCIIRFDLRRNATGDNMGQFYKKSVRSTYDRTTKTASVVSEKVTEYDFNWFFSDVSSDAKFTIILKNTTTGEEEKLNISKYKVDDAGAALEFLLGGLTYTRPVLP